MIFYLFLFCHWTLHPGSQWTRWWGAASPGDLTPWLMLMIWALWPELGERRKPGEQLTWDHCYHVTSPHKWSPIHHPRTHTTLHTLFFPKAIYNVCDNNTLLNWTTTVISTLVPWPSCEWDQVRLWSSVESQCQHVEDIHHSPLSHLITLGCQSPRQCHAKR